MATNNTALSLKLTEGIRLPLDRFCYTATRNAVGSIPFSVLERVQRGGLLYILVSPFSVTI